MVSIQIKFIDEGLSPNLEELSEHISSQLLTDNISVEDEALLTLKIKFTIDNDQEKILLQLRETETKNKLGEKVIHYFEESWKDDVVCEAHALVANTAIEVM